MKKIEKDEIFQNLAEFLKKKGIQLTDGSYAQTIQKSCRIMADVINMGQQGIGKAKDGIDKTLDQVRTVIHEKTAPKPPVTSSKGGTPDDTGKAGGPPPAAMAPEPGPVAAHKTAAPKKRAAVNKQAKTPKPDIKRSAAKRPTPPS